MKRLRSHLSYANVVATLALFLVLAGGTALAAKQFLPKNSVGTKQLKNNSITGAKVKDGSITGSKLALSSLGTVPSAAHADSATTATSATTAATATSATNAEALQGMSPAQIAAAAKLSCPTGTTLLAGTCFETTRRPAASWQEAARACGKAKRTLPDFTELAAYDITNNNLSMEWTANLQYYSAASEPGYRAIAMYFYENGYSISLLSWESGTEPYRCVVPPGN